MPYKNPEMQRAHTREAVRRHREARGKTPPSKTGGKTLTSLAELKMETARDVVAVLRDELSDVRKEMQRGSPERARVAGYLCGLLLRAFETADLEERLTELEEKLAASWEVQ